MSLKRKKRSNYSTIEVNMMKAVQLNNMQIEIPDGFIVFISGVPGVGKTTISYELLKKVNAFRIIEETDLIREVLLGYNSYLEQEFPNQSRDIINQITITDHTKLLSLEEAKMQCKFMLSSFECIISRQKRKGIPSIINGVHIIPETLNGLVENHNVIYINLYINSEQALYTRLLNRNPKSYMINHVPFIFQTNKDLYNSTEKLSKEFPYLFNNIDITELSIDETIFEIMQLIKRLLSKD